MAQPLIILNEEGQFVLVEESAKRIAAIQGPVAVISVAGIYRTGKSYLLNRLLGRQSGFAVGPTVNPCTKVGSARNEHSHKRVFTFGTSQLKEMACLFCWLIRKELDPFNKTQTTTQRSLVCSLNVHTHLLTVLAILLSSFFVYNSTGVIDERALEALSFITNLTKIVTGVFNYFLCWLSDAPSSEFSPKFLWCLRDFSLRLQDESGKPISSLQYLERCLADVWVVFSCSHWHFSPGASSEKNQIRRSLKDFFPSRDCSTLVRPTNGKS